MKKTTKKLAVGTAIAAVGGYLAGILTAPKSGKETREDIKEAASKAVTEAEKKLKSLHSELDQLIEKAKAQVGKAKDATKKQLQDAIDAASKAKEKMRQVLSAVHEGDADDKDLKSAVDEGKKAVDHLKNFLKKS